MTDDELIRLMNDAAEGAKGPALDPQVVLHAGRWRVRRRVAIHGVGWAAAAIVIAGVAVSAPYVGGDKGHHGPRGVDASNSSGAADYRPGQVSRPEALRRCTAVGQNKGYGDGPFTLRGHGPWLEGESTRLVLRDKPQSSLRCVIPQAGLAGDASARPTSLPEADDHVAFRAACGAYLGWDFTGWDVVVADWSATRAVALLRSTNGYLAQCVLHSGKRAESHVDIRRASATPIPDGGHTETARLSCDRVGASYSFRFRCATLGWISLRSAAQVEVSYPGGSVESDVHDGWYALAVDLSMKKSAKEPAPFEYTISDADGTALANYSEADLPARLWDETS